MSDRNRMTLSIEIDTTLRTILRPHGPHRRSRDEARRYVGTAFDPGNNTWVSLNVCDAKAARTLAQLLIEAADLLEPEPTPDVPADEAEARDPVAEQVSAAASAAVRSEA